MEASKKIIPILACMAILSGCSHKSDPMMALTNAQLETQVAFQELQANKIAAARTKLNEAMQLDPQAASPWYVMGYLDEVTGREQDADEDFKKALTLDPHSGQAHNNYGTFLCHLNHTKEAVEQFNIAINEPNYYNVDTAYENAGLCLVRAGELAQARNYFIEATNNNPFLKHSLFELALIDYQLQNYDESKIYLDKYIALVKKPGKASSKLRRYLKMKHHPKLSKILPEPLTV